MARTSTLSRIAAATIAFAVFGTSHVLAQSPGARFRTGVDLVLLNVTVLDGAQRHVTDLQQGDFVVLEEGAPQQLTFFRKADVRLALALVIDSSASMEKAMTTAQDAAVGFVRELAPTDMGTVIDFDSRVRVLSDFTNDRTRLEEAIRSTMSGGATSLYNALYIALNELGKIRPNDDADVLRRRIIVLLSDGEDTSSLLSFEEALEAASRSDTVIYTIGLGVDSPPAKRTPGDASFVLTRLAERTGGRAFFPAQAKDLTGVYRTIREELSSQYVLAYISTSQRSGQWRRVQVRVNRSDVAVRTRQGYFVGD